MFVPNHLHLIVKGKINNPPKEVDVLNKWFTELVEKVSMKVVAGPTSVYVNEEGNEGLTGTCTLATSHASIHIWDSEKPSLFQFDIYSCSKFLVEDVIQHINEFELIEHEFIFIDRNNSMKVIDSTHKLNTDKS